MATTAGVGLLEAERKMAMKRVFIIAFLFLIPALARADSVVNVVIQPAYFVDVQSPHTGTVSATFLWDTSTEILSNITSLKPVASEMEL
jgi:hypothetical protein